MKTSFAGKQPRSNGAVLGGVGIGTCLFFLITAKIPRDDPWRETLESLIPIVSVLFATSWQKIGDVICGLYSYLRWRWQARIYKQIKEIALEVITNPLTSEIHRQMAQKSLEDLERKWLDNSRCVLEGPIETSK